MLREAVSSVMSQSLNDWQLVIIDDHSSATAASALPTATIDNKRVVILTNDQRRGVAYSRNRGIETGTGQWLVFLDDDDTLEPDFLEQAKEAATDLEDGEVLAMPCKMHPASIKTSWGYHAMKVQVRRNRRRPSRDDASFYSLISSPPQMTSLICRQTLLAGVRFDEELSYGEDLFLWAELLRNHVRVKTQMKRKDCNALIRYHSMGQLSEIDDETVINYFDGFQQRFGPLDIRTQQAIKAKVFLRSLWGGQWSVAGREFALGIKKPRIFLGLCLSQTWLKGQIFLSYLLYRLIKFDS